MRSNSLTQTNLSLLMSLEAMREQGIVHMGGRYKGKELWSNGGSQAGIGYLHTLLTAALHTQPLRILVQQISLRISS